MKFPKLALPEFDARIKSEQEETFIFDIIRKKYIVLTPEEWVRQHFIHLLIQRLGYPQGLFQVERGHQYFGSAKRSDILIYSSEGKPHLLVECKAPTVAINTSAVNQIATYNKTLEARFVAISNGLKHFVWEMKGEQYVQLKEFPVYTT